MNASQPFFFKTASHAIRSVLCAGAVSMAFTAPALAQAAAPGQAVVVLESAATPKQQAPAYLGKYMDVSQGVRLEDGVIVYRHGKTMPLMLCQPLRVCDIQLQAGEKVSSVVNADTERWELTEAMQGKTPHVVVRPLIYVEAPDTTTNILIFTDKRTYSVILKSSQVHAMQGIRFEYAKNVVAKKAVKRTGKSGRVRAHAKRAKR